MPRQFFLIACEPSGDAHGAELIREIKKLEPNAACRGLGGPKMAGAGMELLHDMTTFSALGFGDVVRQYFKYRRIFYQALRNLNQNRPDALILIDSPAFNLRFAKKIKKRIPTFYYISPQIWAWGMRRIHTIKKTVSKMIAILPFEKALYDKYGVPCEFVGHPLLDQVKISKPHLALREEFGIRAGSKAIGIFAGSRASEVRRNLPLMLETAALIQKGLPDCEFFLSESANVDSSIYEEIIRPYAALSLPRFRSRFYDRLASLDFALITSGTTTTEAAIMGVPYILVYRASQTTHILGKFLIRVRYLALINIMADKEIVPEYIQKNFIPENIAEKVKGLLTHPELTQKMRREMLDAIMMLGEKGASGRAAAAIFSFLAPAEDAPKQTPASPAVRS